MKASGILGIPLHGGSPKSTWQEAHFMRLTLELIRTVTSKVLIDLERYGQEVRSSLTPIAAERHELSVCQS